MIATTLEQSRKLVELGIDASTADMFYSCGMDVKTREWDYDLTIIDEYNKIDIGDIPAWSLSALLKAIKSYTLQTTSDNKCFIVADRTRDAVMSFEYNDPIDACYDAILKLNAKKED